MRRLLLGSLLCLVAITTIAAQPATIPLNPIRIAPHAWYVQAGIGEPTHDNQGFTANAGFVVTDEGVVVFDALGTPPLGEALIRATSRLRASTYSICAAR